MRIFLSVLILIFSLQSFIKADDIKDFEIEGMSIGDSLLDHFESSMIKKSITKQDYKSDKYLTVQFLNLERFKTYDGMHINFLNKDKKMIIHAIHGMKNYINNIEDCKNDKLEVVKEFSSIFQNLEFQDSEFKHSQDKSGNSYVNATYINFKNQDRVSIACFDWSKEMGFWDHLRISIYTKEFGEFTQ